MVRGSPRPNAGGVRDNSGGVRENSGGVRQNSGALVKTAVVLGKTVEACVGKAAVRGRIVGVFVRTTAAHVTIVGRQSKQRGVAG